MRTRTVLLLAAALPVTAAAAATALRAGRWELRADRHHITLAATPRPTCPHCHGGGFVPGDPFHDRDACGCWWDRPALRIRLLPMTWADSPF
ncbi:MULTISPECIES: hypothetical protein [unclassified Streptomyces]|uniref:hypothetical protein n=1 Tax=unclassified Streptomyces TaxID=2593676 RepID=UPI00037CC689|nr:MULTISPECIES: hypothetical protein [unclassified Streptomyces]MYS37197.1 hypothetical protein [Streptomyces sp. SID4920]MYX68622.1 hypothetical protein [Streptomyces sp. SID8373]